MQFTIAIASYGRAGNVTTHALFPSAIVVVPESQADSYRRHHGENVVAIPDSEDGGISRKRNAILNRYPVVLILDDDITRISMFEEGERKELTGAYLLAIVARYFDLAQQLGVTFWGVAQNTDAFAHDTYQPFNLVRPICGPFGAHLSTDIRYDETIKGKEDFDFWLRTLKAHRKTLRINKMYYHHDHAKKAGGFASMRTIETEKSDMAILRKRYGDIVSFGGSSGGGHKGTDILNTLVSQIIPGC